MMLHGFAKVILIEQQKRPRARKTASKELLERSDRLPQAPLARAESLLRHLDSLRKQIAQRQQTHRIGQ